MRTAITIMAFGFLVQKFDLFLRTARESLNARSSPERSHIVGDIAGLLLIVLGGAMMVLAALRFRKTTLDIDAREVRVGPGTRLDLILPVERDVLGGIQRVLELEAVRVDREDRRPTPGDKLRPWAGFAARSIYQLRILPGWAGRPDDRVGPSLDPVSTPQWPRSGAIS